MNNNSKNNINKDKFDNDEVQIEEVVEVIDIQPRKVVAKAHNKSDTKQKQPVKKTTSKGEEKKSKPKTKQVVKPVKKQNSKPEKNVEVESKESKVASSIKNESISFFKAVGKSFSRFSELVFRKRSFGPNKKDIAMSKKVIPKSKIVILNTNEAKNITEIIEFCQSIFSTLNYERNKTVEGRTGLLNVDCGVMYSEIDLFNWIVVDTKNAEHFKIFWIKFSNLFKQKNPKGLVRIYDHDWTKHNEKTRRRLIKLISKRLTKIINN